MKVDPKLGGQGNVPKLGGQRNVLMFGGQWNVLMFGGQWNVPSLVANGRRKRRFFSPFPTFPLKQLYLDLHFFPFNIKVLFYHGFKPLFMHFFPFPWPINCDRIF